MASRAESELAGILRTLFASRKSVLGPWCSGIAGVMLVVESFLGFRPGFELPLQQRTLSTRWFMGGTALGKESIVEWNGRSR